MRIISKRFDIYLTDFVTEQRNAKETANGPDVSGTQNDIFAPSWLDNGSFPRFLVLKFLKSLFSTFIHKKFFCEAMEGQSNLVEAKSYIK